MTGSTKRKETRKCSDCGREDPRFPIPLYTPNDGKDHLCYSCYCRKNPLKEAS